jgi:putative membrane protein insertion efficiency factor
MVFIGGWRPRRRRRYGPYDDQGPEGYGPYGNYPPGYGPGPYPRRYRRGFGPAYGGGGGSCLRDMLLLEGGCCLAELLGCGPQLLLVAPRTAAQLLRRDGMRTAFGAEQDSIVSAIVALIERYQTDVSPRRRPCCRYTPTCSHYAVQALQQHGVRRGLRLSAGRLLRCRPGASGGADPVPEAA